jgi:6,7-dimethyl-8-ribityllumazine synthase
VVVAKFNKFVTSKLLSSCLDGLTKHGVKDQDIEVVRVPGAFELPLVAKTLATSGRLDAVICLGAVIRGDTPHFDYICNEVEPRNSARPRWRPNMPIIFGVLTTETVAQAIERADPEQSSTGVARRRKSAIEMASVIATTQKALEAWRLPHAGHPVTTSRAIGSEAEKLTGVALWDHVMKRASERSRFCFSTIFMVSRACGSTSSGSRMTTDDELRRPSRSDWSPGCRSQEKRSRCGARDQVCDELENKPHADRGPEYFTHAGLY